MPFYENESIYRLFGRELRGVVHAVGSSASRSVANLFH